VEGEIDLAIAEFTQALRLNPGLQGAHEALGDIYLKKHEFEASEGEFEDELKVDPYNLNPA
jgi:lipoprotein NlpI